jgi:hypothetical protein
MKQIFKTVLKALLVIILFTGGSVALSTIGAKTVNTASAATYNQVYEYLVANGYTVISLHPQTDGKYDWEAVTIKHDITYNTTIYCTASSVIGNTDVAM